MQSSEHSLSGLHPYLHPPPGREGGARIKNAGTAQSSLMLKGIKMEADTGASNNKYE